VRLYDTWNRPESAEPYRATARIWDSRNDERDGSVRGR
jgi:hypothetical protein